ncbi:MAG: ABC transporter substrate-binding protein [Planctomycetota bacterium]|nr:ABC transporter substrate-binding protein [Planctomycetota bacterium]
MNQAKIALITLVAVLLGFQLLDRFNEPARMKAVKESLDAQARAFEQLSQELNTLSQSIADQQAQLRFGNEAREGAAEAAQASQDKIYAELGRIRKNLEGLEVRAVASGTQSDAGSTTQAPADQAAVTEPQTPGDDAATTTPLPAGDGLVRENGNFLLPPRTDYFHPDRIGGTLHSFSSTPPGLNPIIENAADVSSLHGLCNGSLATRDSAEPAKWRSELATSVLIENDYHTYTFALRRGVMWQVPSLARTDPENFGWLDKPFELTAHDFVFYVEMAKHEDVQAPQAKAYFDDLDRAEALDDYTLRLHWKRKVYTSLGTSMGLEPLPRHIYSKDQSGNALPAEQISLAFNKHWFDEQRGMTGVGRYVLWDYEADKQIRLRRNPRFWGAGDHFDYRDYNCSIRDPEAKLTSFKNGQVESYSLTPTQYKTNILDGREGRFNADKPREGEIAFERTKGLVYYYIGWNMRRPLFSDRRVRQALSHAFPKQRIIDEVFFGLGQPAVGNVHPDSAYFNDQLKDYDFDLDRAQELLFQAGWEDSNGDGLLDKTIDGTSVPFSFKVKYYANSPEWDRTLGVYQAQLRKLGIEMTPLPLEWKLLVRVYEDRDFDAVGGGWRMSYEVDFEQLWHSKYAEEPRSSNHCGFADPEADKLAEELRVTFDLEERKRVARAFQAIIHREQPYTFFRTGEGVFAWHNRSTDSANLGGVVDALETLHPFYNRDSSYWYIKE